MNKFKGDNAFNIFLLKEIEKHPCLYNYHLPDYTSREVTEQAWKEIANKFKKTSEECKIRWKNLRGSLTRNLSKRLKSVGNRPPKTFYLTKYMKFIMPFAKSRQGYTYDELKLTEGELDNPLSPKINLEENWNINRSDIEIIREDDNLEIPSTPGKDPLETRISDQTSNEDSDKHFLLSLLPHIYCFTATEKLQFQIKTLNVIEEIMNKRECVNKE